MLERIRQEIPELARRGKLIGMSNATEAIRTAAENNPEDKYREFRATWNPRIDEIKRRFFPDFWTPNDKFELPTPPLAIEDMRNMKALASYRIVPDGYGLNDKFTVNEKWMVEKNGRYSWFFEDQDLVETAIHEITHEKINYLIKLGKMKPMSNPHGKPFQKIMAGFGLNVDDGGHHLKPCDDPNSPTGILLKDFGIPMTTGVDLTGMPKGINYWDFIKSKESGGPRKGRSTLSLWECECVPPQRARIGKAEFDATCNICDMPFRRKS